MSAPVTRLNLSGLIDAKSAHGDSPGESKSAPANFIPLHLTEVQLEQAPGEGDCVIATPRSRSNSVASGKGTPRGETSAQPSSPRTPTSARSSISVDRLSSCSECGTFNIVGSRSRRRLIKSTKRWRSFGLDFLAEYTKNQRPHKACFVTRFLDPLQSQY